MNVEKLEKIEYASYDKKINITLFNKILYFIINTSRNKEKEKIFNDIEKKCIWTNKGKISIQEEYKFQYFGELLERYEERIGNDIKDIRAIALALGYAGKLIEENMIIGTQLVDFLSKIKNLAENDIYLKGALYLYDSKRYYMYAEEFMNKNYTNTEDIIFSLSIFYERIRDFFEKNKKQIIDLVGISKSISVIGNIGIYAWLIKNLYPLVKEDRKKDIALLKALVKIPTGLQKEDTTVYKQLINNNYNKEEIIYLNYLILYYDTIPDRIILGSSVIEEKIAANLCITLINSERNFEINIYDLIKQLLHKYKRFYIKCYGSYTIYDAIKDKLNVTNPITFVELYYELNNNTYSFDILNEKWDIVATMADSEKYQKIFDNFLLINNYSDEKIKECIQKYNQLTNKDYIESFLDYDWKRNDIFKLLVKKNIIILKQIFEIFLKYNKQNTYNHIKEYIKGIYNKKSFEFLKYLLRINKYSIKEINDFGFEFDRLLNNGYKYSNRIYDIYDVNVQRKFLNIKEQKILFECLEKYIFYYVPEMYFKLLEEILKNDYIIKLLKKEELREIYLSLCEINPQKYKSEFFQRKYLNPEELNAIYEQKRIEKEMKIKEELKEAEEHVNEEFDKIEQKNNFKEIYEFNKKFEYSSKKEKFAIEISKNYILSNIPMFSRENEDINYFIKILGYFSTNKELTHEEFIKFTYEYIKEEVQKNGYINTTC